MVLGEWGRKRELSVKKSQKIWFFGKKSISLHRESVNSWFHDVFLCSKRPGAIGDKGWRGKWGCDKHTTVRNRADVLYHQIGSAKWISLYNCITWLSGAMVDTADSKSVGKTLVGSTPTSATTYPYGATVDAVRSERILVRGCGFESH